VEELLRIKDSLLEMGKRVRRQQRQPAHPGGGGNGAAAASEGEAEQYDE
jgi:hypothetical protein